jgi:PAS domain S-box-containing protein
MAGRRISAVTEIVVQITGFEQSILEHLQVALVVTDASGVITRWSRGAEALYGWPSREALGQRAVDLLVPESGQFEADGIMASVLTGESWQGEFEVRRKDGSTILVHVTDTPVLDESGQLVAVVGLGIDLTEQKLAERRAAIQYGTARALAEADSLEDAAGEILLAVRDGGGWDVTALWIVDQRAGVLRPLQVRTADQGRLEAFERATHDYTFAPGIGLPGRVWSSGEPAWIPDVAADTNFPRSPIAERAGLRSAFSFPILLRDQVLGVIEGFGSEVKEPDGELLQMLGAIGSQIGQFMERKEAEAALRDSEARKRAILDASLDCIIAMNQEGVITDFNPAAERTFGYVRHEVVGQRLSELLVPPALRERHERGLARYRETGEGTLLGRRTELTALRKDGTEFPVEIAVTRVALPGPPLFKGSIRDITDRKRAEEERATLLAAERAALEEAETARRRLAFLVEANTVLASALDFAGALGALGRLAVSLMADICLIDVLAEEGGIRRMVAVHADPDMQALTDRLGGEHAPAPTGPHPAVKVMRTGKSEYSEIMTEQFLRETTRDQEHFEVTVALGFQSYICVPLVARGRVLGTITLVSCDPHRRYGPPDVALAEDVARRTAITVDNARLYEAEQRIRLAAELAFHRTAVLQAVTEALAEPVTAQDVIDVIVRRATEALQATAGAVALLSEDRQTLMLDRWAGYSEESMSSWTSFPLDAPTPLSEAVRTGRPVFLTSREELIERYPVFAGTDSPNHALACVPLVVEGRAVGGMSLSFEAERDFGPEDQELLVAIGRQGAQAIERARAYEAERTARADAEAAERRLAFLANASAILAASVVDFGATLRNVARVAVPEFADWCVVDLAGEAGTVERVALAHADPEKEAMGIQLQERYPPEPRRDTGVYNVLRTGASELYPAITEEMVAELISDPDLRRIILGLGLRSSMTVPMVARGRTIGAITFVAAESGKEYGPADLRLAEDLGRRAGLAVDNARLYQERSYVARTLQQTLLPPRLPTIPGMEVGAVYRPAGEGTEIGGDFYDLFETADQAWAVTIGDVCGKGADAAAVIGLVRYSVRAVAMHAQRPSSVLATVNEALRQQTLNDRFCTVAYARLRPSSAGARLTVCCAGHPLPMILRQDGTVEPAGVPGTLLGVFPDPELTDRVVDLEPGDTVVFYTDGVTEERSGDSVFGDEGLIGVLEQSAGLDAPAVATAIGKAVDAFRADSPRDDMAILVVRVRP